MSDHILQRPDRPTPAVTGKQRCEPPSPASPCVGTCRIDPDTGLCVGCFRNLDEICDWLTLADEQKREIIERCLARRSIVSG